MVKRIHLLSLLIAAIIVFTLFYQMRSKPKQVDWKKEVTCLSEYYNFRDGELIYNYPDNPYIYRNGVKVTLRKKGVCE